MRRMLALAGRSPTSPGATMGIYAVVLALWFYFAIFSLVLDGEAALHSDLPFQLGLLVAFGVTFCTWMSLHAFGFVGGGSGAGFRLALLGFGARVLVAKCVEVTGAEPEFYYFNFYDSLPVLPVTAGPVCWVRNGSLIAYGCGLALVVLATATDFVRRRRSPWWAITAD